MADAAKPILALAIGDPAGIGPELAAKLVADAEVRAAADLVVVGDFRVLRQGADVAGVTADFPVITAPDAIRPGRSVLLDLGHLDPASISVGVAAKAGGQFALENFRTALRLAAAGRVAGVCFTPFNKAAM